MTGPNRPHILCVDDEPHALKALEDALRDRFSVTTAPDGVAAVAALETGGPFPVLLSDFRMPGMDGVALFRRACRIAPDTVRILISGAADLATVASAVNEGHIHHLLLKPCPTDRLIAIIENAIEHYRLGRADRELTDRKLEQITDQLLRAERLATLGTLAACIGHELNNATTSLLGLVEMIRMDAAAAAPLSPAHVDDLGRIAEHLRLHGRHLLGVGRPRPEQPAALDLRDVVGDIVAMLRNVGKTKHLVVRVELPEAPLPVFADRHRLEQVLVNLIGNAADAVADADGRGNLVRIVALRRDDGMVACTIEDDGCGIPEDKLNAVFEPYFTTKPPGRGTGLGLPVVKQIVEAYDGTISVCSIEGRGSAVTFTLPLSERSTDAPVAAAIRSGI